MSLRGFWDDVSAPWAPVRHYCIEVFKRRGKWTSRIRHDNGEILWSTTAQLYSRKIDAWQTAKRFSIETGVPIKEVTVPKVGSGKGARHFSYGAKGQAAAKKHAEKSGKPLTKKRAK